MTQSHNNLSSTLTEALSTTSIKVISFDIFDTLLYRPFVKPQDVFKYIEVSYNAKGFSRARKNAERRAKHILKREVSYDEIYNVLAGKFYDIKDKEQSLERDTLKANKKVFKEYSKLKNKGYRLIATSDMYYSKAFLKEVLEDNGYFFDEIYVSNEYNRTKSGGGELYDVVLSDLKKSIPALEPGEILHIGDNYYSDYLSAKRKKWNAIHITTAYDDLFRENKFLKKYYKFMHKSLAASMIVGNILKNNGLDFLYNLGYNIVSFLSLVYASFILAESRKRKIDELLFVARDGYFIQKVMSVLLDGKNDIKLHYVYAPRKQFFLTHYVERKGGFYNLLMPKSFRNYVVDYFNIDTNGVKAYKYYKLHKDVVAEKQQEVRDEYNYQGYINGIVAGENVAIIDGASVSLRAQKLISMETNRNVFGFYLISFSTRLGSNRKYQTARLVRHLYENIYFTSDISNMLERIFQSKEETADFVNSKGEVTFRAGTTTKMRTEVYGKIEDGVQDSINSFKPLLNDSILALFNNSKLFLRLIGVFRLFDKANFKRVESELYVEHFAEEKKEKRGNRK